MSLPAYPPEVLEAALVHLKSRYPEEGCGVVVRRGEAWDFIGIRNVVGRYHEADPDSFPRDARSAYLLEPGAQRRIWTEAEAGQLEIVTIVHSHCDEDATFSSLDEEMALVGPGQPLHPGLEYLIVSLHRGIFHEARVFRWAEGGFVGRSVGFPR